MLTHHVFIQYFFIIIMRSKAELEYHGQKYIYIEINIEELRSGKETAPQPPTRHPQPANLVLVMVQALFC